MKKNNMENFIQDSLVRIEVRLDDMAATQARHEENLKEHMRRSDAAEEGIKVLKAEIVPLKTHKENVRFAIKVAAAVAGSIAGIALFVLTVLEIIEKFNK